MRVSKSRRSLPLCIMSLFFMSAPMISCGAEPMDPASPHGDPPPAQNTATHTAEELSNRLSESDVVVLGKIDACWVCQFEDPHVGYTEILVGRVLEDEAKSEQLPLGAVDSKLLPSNGIPIYKSAKEEICFLKRTTGRNTQLNRYSVVDVWEETPAHLDLFLTHKKEN